MDRTAEDMKTLWIVHRNAGRRASAAHRAGRCRVVAGSPGGALFAEAPAPDVVLLGIPEEPEAELRFAAQVRERHPAAGWVLLCEPEIPGDEAAMLFAGLGAEILSASSDSRSLRGAIARAGRHAGPLPLDRRLARHHLDSRAARWFRGTSLLEQAEGRRTLWIRGEPGTGRRLLARAVHARGPGGPFLHVACEAELDLDALEARIGRAAAASLEVTICLEDAECLAPVQQRELRSWIELGLPAAGVPAERLRWILVTGDGAPESLLDPELGQLFEEDRLRLPPLREQPDLAEALARSHLGARPLDEAAIQRIRQDPWPGNQAELERRLRRAAVTPEDQPLSPEALAPTPPAEMAAVPAPTPPAPTPPAPTPPSAPPTAPVEPPVETVRRLVQSLTHDLRNPLSSIRAFADLLPDRFDDETFRDEFHRQVERDLERLEERLGRLARFAELPEPCTKPVDISAVLLSVLEERRSVIERRRLLVLRELETEHPRALGEEEELRFAFEAILDAALDWTGERADLYLASRYHPTGLRGAPAIRVLLRFHGGGEVQAEAEPAGRHTSLELWMAEALIRRLQGEFTMESGEDEAVILVDLPAPPA